MAENLAWVGVDWGTSNLRLWGIGAAGEVLFSRQSAQGMGRLAPAEFAGVLARLLADAGLPEGEPMEVLVCGMAGARQGWREAPYLDAPTDLGGLIAGAVAPAAPGSSLSVRILPGVCQRATGHEDVMRGEETQILGLSALFPGFSGLAVLPGTHSKWVETEGRRIRRFATAMTGELFALLRSQSVLRLSIGEAEPGSEGLEEGLAAGLEAPQRLAELLFKVRAGALLSGRTPQWCAGYLSGLLIGAEIGGRRDWLGNAAAEIPLVGGAALCSVYARGLELIGRRGRPVDAAEATLAGLKLARSLG